MLPLTVGQQLSWAIVAWVGCGVLTQTQGQEPPAAVQDAPPGEDRATPTEAPPGPPSAAGAQESDTGAQEQVEHGDDVAGHGETAGALPGHSFHAEVFNEGPRQAAYLMPGTGQVHFPVSTDNPAAQQFFDQGIGQLHGFWYFEAERSFRQAAALDNGCAMFYWGMAMANLKNPTRALKFVAQAKERLEAATPREKMWVAAVEKLCTEKDADGKSISKDKRAQQYTRDLEEILFLDRNDLEVKAFLVGHLWENQRGQLATVSHVAVDALLEQIFAVAPLHPAHHYRIHLWDQRDAKQALTSAALCGPSGPGIAHMWHMPGHIYAGLHRYHDAVWQMEASARVDHRQMLRDQVLPDQIHNYAHNNEWLIRNLLKIGRAHDALALAENMLALPRHPKYNVGDKGSGRYGRQRSIAAITGYRQWEEMLRRADQIFGTNPEKPALLWEKWQHVGVAAALAGQVEIATDMRARLNAVMEQKQAERNELSQSTEPSAEEPTGDATAAGQANAAPTKQRGGQRRRGESKLSDDIANLRKAIASIEAALAAAGGDWAAAFAQAEKASGIDGLLKAEWQAMSGQFAEAQQAVRQEVEKRPNDVVPLAVSVWIGYCHDRIAQVAEPQATDPLDASVADACTGETEDGASGRQAWQRDFEQLRQRAAHADLDTPLLARLKAVASEMGHAGDWRLPLESPSDLGERPPLETLGSLHWSPYPAPAFTVVDATGLEIRPLENGQRAKLVMFYLGFGCLHCMEQLQKFSPETERFAGAGIDVMAISCESLDLLQQGLKNFDVPLAIPLYSDTDLSGFKAFRCHDDFENQPLHGTFLIAPDGRVLWQDIGHEPFMDTEFVLRESQRLLEIWSAKPTMLTTTADGSQAARP
jgi:peroxiredoxin